MEELPVEIKISLLLVKLHHLKRNHVDVTSQNLPIACETFKHLKRIHKYEKLYDIAENLIRICQVPNNQPSKTWTWSLRLYNAYNNLDLNWLWIYSLCFGFSIVIISLIICIIMYGS